MTKGTAQAFHTEHHPLLVHVGNHTDGIDLAIRHDIGQMIWRGRAGAKRIAELGADPVTGADALLDFATYEHGEAGKDSLIGAALKNARVGVGFTPGYFADPKEPDALVRYLADDVPTQHSELRGSGHTAQLVPVLCLRDVWLTREALRDTATQAIAGYPGLVAVCLAAFKNPLAAAPQIRGWTQLLRDTGKVIALRSDEAAIGALANGAVAAAVGSSSTTRHRFVGGGKSTSATPRQRTYDVWHPATMTWIPYPRLEAFAVPPEDLLCPCSVCDGRSIRRYTETTLKIEAVAHSIASLQTLARSVMGAPHPGIAWIEACTKAATEADRLGPLLEGFELGRSARAWRNAVQSVR